MNGRWFGKLRGVTLGVVAFSIFVIPAFAQEGRRVLVHPQPAYPDLAKELSLKGNVRLEVVIGSDGEIKSTKPLGGHPILVQAATEAVKKWKYAPSKEDTTTTLEFSFRP